MTRIALVIGQLGLGGAEKQLCQLAAGLSRKGYQPIVIVLNTGGALEAGLRARGVEVVAMPRKGSVDVRRVMRIARLLREYKPAIVHGVDYAGSAYGRLAGVVAGVPILIGGVRSEWTPPKRTLYLEMLLRPLTDMTISNSFAGRQAWARLTRRPPEEIIVVPNGFDFESMGSAPPGFRPLRELLGLPSGEAIVGCVGSIYDLKNPLMLVDVATSLAAQGVRAHFVWVGDGPMRREVERAVGDRGLGGVFHLVGKRDDAAWLAGDFQVGVLPSVVEGLPNAVMEYMYWSMPVVTTDVGDCAKLVEHGRTGFVVRKHDSAAMAAHLKSLILDPVAARRMGSLGREKLEIEYTAEGMLERTIAVYEDLILKKWHSRRQHKSTTSKITPNKSASGRKLRGGRSATSAD